MVKHKTIVKELKRPDHFVDFWTRSWTHVATALAPHRKPALGAAVAVAVVLIGASIFNYWDGRRHLAASGKLSRVQDIAIAELLPETADPKDDSARKDDVPRFKTAAERQGAVLKELDQFLEHDATADLKDEALLMKGSTLLALGRPDDALGAYQAALDKRLDVRLRFLAHEGQGYAYEAKGDIDRALAAFAKLATDASEFQGFYQDRALYHKARLTEGKGDKPGAVALYRQILDKTPDTTLKDEISDRLAVIEAK